LGELILENKRRRHGPFAICAVVFYRSLICIVWQFVVLVCCYIKRSVLVLRLDVLFWNRYVIVYLSLWFCRTWVTTLVIGYSYFRVAEASTRIFKPFNFTVDIFVETHVVRVHPLSSDIDHLKWTSQRSGWHSCFSTSPSAVAVIFLLLLFIPSSWVRPEIGCHLFFSLPLIYLCTVLVFTAWAPYVIWKIAIERIEVGGGVGELCFVHAACVHVSWADFFAIASVCRSTSGTTFQTTMTSILLNIVYDLWFIWCSLHNVPTLHSCYRAS
jgi:hypothetical protein